MDLEISLVERFGWSLRDIDETDIESLIPFVMRITRATEDGGEYSARRKTEKEKKVYCDQVNWM